MKILLAHDVPTDGDGNPYTLQLLHSLETHNEVEAVQHGTSWMGVPEAKFDIVHVQWPEGLTKWSEPDADQLDFVQHALARWSKESVVVATIHNEHPHHQDTASYRKLYRSVYAFADGIIHLGNQSREVVRRRYKKELQAANETVIPHGNYDWFPNEVCRAEARRQVAIEEENSVFLCFGKIRHPDELQLLWQGFAQADVSGKHLLLAGRLPGGWTQSWVRALLWIKSNVTLEEKFVKAQDVQYFLNAADVLIIPRIESLNSGGVSLGFTFGCVVVGPDVGVIGEMLRETGNPIFDPRSAQSVAEALQKANQLVKTEKPKQNQKIAEQDLSWERVSNEHIKFYKSLMLE